MKKLISILLVAMLIIGMFPATALTAFAADTEIVFNLGDNGSATHKDGSTAKTTYAETVSGYTLNLTSGSKMYPSSYDAKGNSCIKLGTSSAAGSFSLTVPDDVTSVVFEIAKYKTNTSKVTINGTAYTLTNASNNGQYDEITVDTSANKTISLTTASGGYRAMVNTITFVVSGGSEEPEQPDVPTCEHTNTEPIGEAKEPTCTETGITAGEKCADCDEIITAQKEIDAKGHTYVDGICSVCGEEKPAGYTKVTNVSDLKVGDQVIIVATGYNYALSTTQNSNNRGRAEVAKDGDVVSFGEDTQVLTLEEGTTTGTFAFNTGKGYLYAASASSNYLRTETTKSANSSWAITIDANGVATVKAQGTNTRNWLRYNNGNSIFSCYGSGQSDIAIYKLYTSGGSKPDESECTHELVLKDERVEPTCTQPGKEAYYECACGETKQGGEEIPALNHNMVEGVCSRCGLYETTLELMTAVPGSSDKVVIYASGNAMGAADNGSGKLTGIATAPVDGELPYYTSVAVLTVGKDSEYYTFANAEGKYLTSGATGNGMTFEAELSDLALWTIEEAGTNTWYITNKTASYNGTAQAIEYYNGAFTTFGKGTGEAFQMAFYLVEKGEESCQHPNAYETDDGYDAECGKEGKTNSWYCPDCETTTVRQQTIPALEHNYVDGVCKHCGDEKVLGNYVRVTSLNEVLAGGQFVILAEVDGVYYALDTQTKDKFAAIVVEVSNGSVISDAPVWTAAAANGNITLSTEGNYLGYGSSTDFATKANYEWVVTSADNGTFNFTASSDEKRGIFYRTGTVNKYGAYAVSNDQDEPTEYYRDLQVYKFLQPVMAADGTGYNSIDKALAAGQNNLKLYADATASAAYNGDLYLDLNGFNATVEATNIYACDSSATVTTAGTGVLTTTSNVVTDNTVNGTRYIALNNEGTYTFHVLELKLSAVTLRTSAAGIYYKAVLNCDDVLKGAISVHGMVLSVKNMPGADFGAISEVNDNNCYTEIAGAPSEKNFTSCAVFGIFKEDQDNATRGETEIYANVYLKLNTQEIIVADTTNAGKTVNDADFNGIAWSMKDVMQAVNNKFSTMDTDDKTNLINFYNKWASAMTNWNLTNIAAAATPAE